ncbi:recombinase family protein [Corynebacterium sp. HMSC070E08]|uniref:recombinase family protein n=1 Tax=Corynebacterium sp. HMSC070E08 TaxID=1715006 RepID=UPI003529FEB3
MGYARVSTTDQNPERQHTQLKAAGAVRIYTDHQSGPQPLPRAPASEHDETPLRLNGKGFHLVRPEGIEPPTYWV